MPILAETTSTLVTFLEPLTIWLSTYYEQIGMTPASAITTTFGAFCFAFVVSICWGKLVEDFNWAGGFMAGAFLVGTIWVMNHKLPGWGIAPEMHSDPEGNKLQYGLIFQSHHYGGPWIDMGFAAGFALWIGSIFSGAKVGSSVVRILAVLIGGIIGGGIVGLIGFTGAALPG